MQPLRHTLLASMCAASLFAAFACPAALAQDTGLTEHQVLVPAGLVPPAQGVTGFGISLAIDGDTLLVGAPNADVIGFSTGAVYVYIRTNGEWTQQATLVADDALFLQMFGSAVDLQGDVAFVGAPDDYELIGQAGAVYVFERTGTTWQQTQKLYDNEPGLRRIFGTSLTVDGNHLLVSGGDDPPALFGTSQVHAFEKISGSWLFRQAFEYSGPGSSSPFNFADPMAADEGHLAASHSTEHIQFFERSGSNWVPGQTLDTTNQVRDMDLVSDLCVASYWRPEDGAPSVDVFRRTGSSWELETQLTPSRSGAAPMYGSSVATDGQWVAVGTNPSNFPEPELGEVTVFRKQGDVWLEELLLLPSEAGSATIGAELALDQGRVLTSARLAPPAGRALLFDLNERPISFCTGADPVNSECGGCPCSNDAPVGARGGCLNATFRSAVLEASGTPSVTNDTLRFGLSRANIATFAILVSGSNQAPNNPVNPCFGSGTGITSPVLSGLRCVVGDIRRHGTRATDIQGAVGETNNAWGGADGSAEGLIAQAGLVAGQTRHYQAYYREAPNAICPLEQNTSQGISIVVRP